MPLKGVLVICLLLAGCSNGISLECPLKLGEPLCTWSKK